MGLEDITLSEISQMEKDTLWYLLHVESKNTTSEYNQKKQTDIENKLVVTRGVKLSSVGFWKNNFGG